MKPAPRPIIKELSPYVPGTPAEKIRARYGLNRVHKLASNENLAGIPSPVLSALSARLGEMLYYPDGDATRMKQDLARRLNVKPDSIIVGAGSDELIMYVCMTFLRPGDSIIQSWPAFVRYLQNARIMDAAVKRVPLKNWHHDLNAIAAAVDRTTKIIFIDNPINPVGTYSGRREWESFLKKIPGRVLVVLDQAYFEFVGRRDYPDGLRYCRDYPNLVVLRTFSKAYSLAGLRVGYGVCDPEIAGWINRVRCPFNVNRLAQEAACLSLTETAAARAAIKTINRERDWLQNELTAGAIEFVPSVTNFVLINMGRDSSAVYDEMCRNGIIVRPMKGLAVLDNYIRLTVSHQRKVNRLALREIKRCCGKKS